MINLLLVLYLIVFVALIGTLVYLLVQNEKLSQELIELHEEMEKIRFNFDNNHLTEEKENG